MGFDFLLVQPQAFIEKKKPRHFSLKYVSIPAKKCLAQRKNPSLPVTS